MTIAARASALWATSQYIIILGLLLLASIGLNFWQLKRAWTAPLRAEVAAERYASGVSEKLLDDMQDRARELMEASDTASAQLEAAGGTYRRAMLTRPLEAQCAPGKERMDATNAALGSTEAVDGESR